VFLVENVVVKRSLPALKLERSPMVYFLAQVRFSAILAMAEHLSAIQERLRKLGYPLFTQVDTYNIVLTPPSPPRVEQVALWNFAAADRKTGIILSSNFVAFQTTKYTTYEETLPKITEALHAVHDVAQIGVFERVGLRYLDLITPNWENQKFSTYLKPEVIGISGPAIGAETLHHSTVYAGKTEFGTIVIRFNTHDGPNILPPDIAIANLDMPKVPESTRVGTLDFDHFLESQDPFSPKLAETMLADLHDAISRAFNECATAEALELWGKRDLT
jgi:uncharacterized protein (TIGR04255 family)